MPGVAVGHHTPLSLSPPRREAVEWHDSGTARNIVASVVPRVETVNLEARGWQPALEPASPDPPRVFASIGPQTRGST